MKTKLLSIAMMVALILAAITRGQAQEYDGPCLPPTHGLDDHQSAFCGSTVTQTIALSAGWNWFSVYVEGDAVELIQAIENGLGDKGITIKASEISTDYYDDFGWFGELDALGIVNEQMYLINVTESCTIELQGTPANPANHTITINPGWNWIGFPCAEAVSVAVALGGFEAVEGDVLKSNETSTDYYGEDFGWFGELQTLEPGQGYLYKYNGTTPKSLVFSTTAGGKSVFFRK